MSEITIGLTGGIGSGKTYISQIFEMMGIPVYNSDEKAKHLMNTNPKLKSDLINLLGEQAYEKDDSLNKQWIAKKIFDDAKLLSKVNSLVHPAVRKDFKNWAKNNKSPYVINEAALFIETGNYSKFDALISVLSPLSLRIDRVKERSEMSEDEILKRIQNQSSDDEKISKSDFLIYNDYSTCLLMQCSHIHHEILSLDVKK